MIRAPRLTSPEAEALYYYLKMDLNSSGPGEAIEYIKKAINKRIVIPFHKSKILPPKIIK